MEDILLVHRKSNRKFMSAPSQAAVWQTCLRSILFCDDTDLLQHQDLLEPEDQVLRGPEALHFLLEILCGLHSPVIGETEVFGQFRNFVETRRQQQDVLFSESQKWLAFVFAEVKRARAEHLIGIGSQSYGSLLRKYCKDIESGTFLGSGQLMQEILPWLAHKQQVNIVCRQPEKIRLLVEKFNNLQVTTYKEPPKSSEALIIAAPLKDESVLQLCQQMHCPPEFIYDLRGEENNLASLVSHQASDVRVLSLQQFFSEIEDTKKETLIKINALKALLLDKALSFTQRTELRPLGWDDICA